MTKPEHYSVIALYILVFVAIVGSVIIPIASIFALLVVIALCAIKLAYYPLEKK